MVDIANTFGALLVGAFIAMTFSGVVTVQSFAYFKFFSNDHARVKVLVSTVWLLDLCHSAFVCASVWHYLIRHYGQTSIIDDIPWSLALTIAVTAILTFLVHCFFVNRIYKLSHQNRIIFACLGFLAVARLGFACLTTGTMISLGSLSRYVHKYHWTFTIGLSLSSALDVLITSFSCYFLLNSRQDASSMNYVIDKLMLYTFENGALTSAATIASMALWLALHRQLWFMCVHFCISKFYAISLMATLNARKSLQAAVNRPQTSGSGSVPVFLPSSTFRGERTLPDRKGMRSPDGRGIRTKSQIYVNVERTVQYDLEEDQLGTPDLDYKPKSPTTPVY